MTSRTIRVTVRGSFDQLTEAQLAELVAEQADHVPLGGRGRREAGRSA